MRAFRIAYDGRPYRGFQRQPAVETVEDTIFSALRRLDVLSSDAEKPAGYAAAGRTDAGVSAVAQTVAFETPEWLTPRALNSELPATIRSWATAAADSSFHATHDAVQRTYTYHLYAPPSVESFEEVDRPGDGSDLAGPLAGDHPPVDDDRFRGALSALAGTHDLHNLTPDDWNTERSLSLSVRRDGSYLVVRVTAGGFSRELVRRLVTLVHEIGIGNRPLGSIDRILGPEPLPGSEGIAPAPPEPLVLTEVSYPSLTFRTDPDAAQSARRVFERFRVERQTAGRVAGQLRDGIRE